MARVEIECGVGAEKAKAQVDRCEVGCELLKVRATRRLKDTIVAAVTAEASSEQIAKARAAGFDGFLGKPLDPDRFPDQIRRLLRGEPVWEMN